MIHQNAKNYSPNDIVSPQNTEVAVAVLWEPQTSYKTAKSLPLKWRLWNPTIMSPENLLPWYFVSSI